MADLHGSLWTCILSGQRHFWDTSSSATSQLAFGQVLAPEISRGSGFPQAQSDQGSRPSAVSLNSVFSSIHPRGWAG